MAEEISAVLSAGIRRQVETLRNFLTTPIGVFETIDTMIANTRTTLRELRGTLKVPTFLRG